MCGRLLCPFCSTSVKIAQKTFLISNTLIDAWSVASTLATAFAFLSIHTFSARFQFSFFWPNFDFGFKFKCGTLTVTTQIVLITHSTVFANRIYARFYIFQVNFYWSGKLLSLLLSRLTLQGKCIRVVFVLTSYGVQICKINYIYQSKHADNRPNG